MLKERIKNFSTLFFSNVFGQVVALALYPYIARFYLPEDFSRFGYVLSLTLFLSIFATGQLHTALLNPESDSEAEDIIGMSTIMVIITTILVGCYTLIFDLSLLVVPFYLLLHSLNEIAKMVYIRRRAFSLSASSQISFRVIGNGLKLLPLLVALKSIGLIFSEVFSLLIINLYALRKRVFNINLNFQILRKYWRFPAIQTTTVSLALLIADFPILFWGQKYSNEQLGYYVMGQKLLITPAMVFSSAVQNSSVHNFIKSKHQLKYYLLLISGTTILGLCGYLLIRLLGEQLFISVLGEKWINGFEIYEYMSLLFVTKFGLTVTQSVFVLQHEVKSTFVFRGIQLVVLFASFQVSLDFFQALQVYIVLDLVTDIFLTMKASFLILKSSKGKSL